MIAARAAGGWKRKTANTPTQARVGSCRYRNGYERNLGIVPTKEQHQKLDGKLRGHYGYYGIIGKTTGASWNFGKEPAKDLAT